MTDVRRHSHPIVDVMTPIETRALRILRQEPQGLERGDLADLMGTDPKNAGNALVRLMAKGLVGRRPSPRRSNAFVYVARVE